MISSQLFRISTCVFFYKMLFLYVYVAFSIATDDLHICSLVEIFSASDYPVKLQYHSVTGKDYTAS